MKVHLLRVLIITLSVMWLHGYFWAITAVLCILVFMYSQAFCQSCSLYHCDCSNFCDKLNYLLRFSEGRKGWNVTENLTKNVQSHLWSKGSNYRIQLRAKLSGHLQLIRYLIIWSIVFITERKFLKLQYIIASAKSRSIN